MDSINFPLYLLPIQVTAGIALAFCIYLPYFTYNSITQKKWNLPKLMILVGLTYASFGPFKTHKGEKVSIWTSELKQLKITDSNGNITYKKCQSRQSIEDCYNNE